MNTYKATYSHRPEGEHTRTSKYIMASTKQEAIQLAIDYESYFETLILLVRED